MIPTQGNPLDRAETSSEVSPFHCFPAIILYLYILGEVHFEDNSTYVVAARL